MLDDVFDTRADLDYPDTESTSKGVTALVEWQINDRLMIKNILAYRENETGQQIDFDSLPVNDLQDPYLTADDQTSEELQILWSGTGVEALLGFYYLDASAYNEFDVLLGQTGDLIGLHGRNLSDKEYRTSGYDFLNIPNPLGLEGTVTAFYGDPRTFSGSIEVRF